MCEAREVTGRRTAQENSRKNAHDALTKHHITLQGGWELSLKKRAEIGLRSRSSEGLPLAPLHSAIISHPFLLRRGRAWKGDDFSLDLTERPPRSLPE